MDIFDTHNSQTPQETTALGQTLAALLKENPGKYPRVFCLYGDLGSGKTTFTQGLAAGLGINERILSPTYIITRHYDLPDDSTLYHLDLYRIQEPLPLKEMLDDSDNYVIIEWAEKLGDNLPKDRIDIHCETQIDGSHTIAIQLHL
jgi:tRNA threonylcarbamoyladenosine biosynthesis protein TsaE